MEGLYMQPKQGWLVVSLVQTGLQVVHSRGNEDLRGLHNKK